MAPLLRQVASTTHALGRHVWRGLRRDVWRPLWRRTVRSEVGEGVISAAIAVLIMAFLGVAMWVGFKETLGNTQKSVDTQVTRIGTDAGGAPTGVGGTK